MTRDLGFQMVGAVEVGRRSYPGIRDGIDRKSGKKKKKSHRLREAEPRPARRAVASADVSDVQPLLRKM